MESRGRRAIYSDERITYDDWICDGRRERAKSFEFVFIRVFVLRLNKSVSELKTRVWIIY